LSAVLGVPAPDKSGQAIAEFDNTADCGIFDFCLKRFLISKGNNLGAVEP
jgi:hypothetical protein